MASPDLPGLVVTRTLHRKTSHPSRRGAPRAVRGAADSETAMQALTQQRLAGNAYRTLGVSAGASQAAVDGAARRMRIWPDPKRIPPTAWDLPWLGPVARSRGDIEQAVARLSEPPSRLEERLLWYHGERPPPPPGGNGHSHGPNPADDSPAQRHYAAVGALHAAVFADPEATDPGRWQRVMGQFAALAASPEAAAWLTRAEQDGDFEKRAAAGEIDAALKAVPLALAAALIPKAEAALARNDMETCAGLVLALRAAGSLGDEAAGPVGRLLDAAEDALAAQCRELDAELRDKLRTNRQEPQPFYADNYAATLKATGFYNDTINPALGRFYTLAAGDTDRLTRARSRCGEALELLGLGWEWSGKFVLAERTLLSALDLAQGSPAEVSIRKALARCEPLAEREREEDRQRAAWGLPSQSAAPPPPLPEPAAPATTGGSGWGNSRIGIGVIAVILFAAVRLVSRLGDDSGGNSSRYRPTVDSNQIQRQLDLIRQSQRPTTAPGSGWERFFDQAASTQPGPPVDEPDTAPGTNPFADSVGEVSREE